MCKDFDNREALEITGYLCPVTQSVKKAAKAKESQGSPDTSDPYIAARLAN
jgi:hypothetical protein